MAGETMASSEPRFDLSPLQRTVLAEFFRRERGFFLTGGGALVGYHLHHRFTDDLDLFTLDEAAYVRSLHVLPAVAEAQAEGEQADGVRQLPRDHHVAARTTALRSERVTIPITVRHRCRTICYRTS